MKASPKHSNPNYKSTYPGKQAYNIPETTSNSFPWLNPDYIPFEILGKIVEDRDFEE